MLLRQLGKSLIGESSDCGKYYESVLNNKVLEDRSKLQCWLKYVRYDAIAFLHGRGKAVLHGLIHMTPGVSSSIPISDTSLPVKASPGIKQA